MLEYLIVTNFIFVYKTDLLEGRKMKKQHYLSESAYHYLHWQDVAIKKDL